MKNKLKIVDNIAVYSTGNTWITYRDVISILKNKILSGEITVTSVNYGDDFDEKYRPYTNDRYWGTNLDDYNVTLNSKLEATLSYFSVSRYSDQFENRVFKFKISFNLPENMLILFESIIENEFYYKCVNIRQKELKDIEENRIKEIGVELLKNK